MLDIAPIIFLSFCKNVFIRPDGKFLRKPFLTLDPKITTQDDPFDRWVVNILQKLKFKEHKVYTSGPLTHPDTVIRFKSDDDQFSYLGIEIKKLNADKKGNDPRGMTLDYNSTIPCGTFRVYRPNGEHLDIKGYYLFALLDHRLDEQQRQIYTIIFCDGDVLNDDVELYLEARLANISDYGHGPYGEGSIRKRAMYLYPNPLDSKIAELANQVSLIHRSHDLEKQYPDLVLKHIIRRTKLDGTVRKFFVYKHAKAVKKSKKVPEIELFRECAMRQPKKRAVYKFMIKD